MRTLLVLAVALAMAPSCLGQCVGGNCYGSRFSSSSSFSNGWGGSRFQSSFQSDGFGSRFQSSHNFEFAPRPQIVQPSSFVNLRIQQRGVFGRRQRIDLDAPGVSLRLRRGGCIGGWCP